MTSVMESECIDTENEMARPRLAPEIHKLQGTYSHDPQRENKNAPKANGRCPDAPDYFDDDELQKWHELTDDLQTMGIMSSDCREQMIAYCTAYAGYMQCRREVEKEGMVIDSKDGSKRNPRMTDLHKFLEQMNRLRPEFGLTPASRSKLVSMKSDEEENPMEHLVARLTS